MADLQGLLSNYGDEFDTAVLSADGESAIVYIGDVAYPFCSKSCKGLPGFWSIAELEDLTLVWDEVYSEDEDRLTWIKREDQNVSENGLPMFPFFRSDDVQTVPGNWSLHKIEVTPFPQTQCHCYCAAKQLPKAEYKVLNHYNMLADAVEDLYSDVANDGWYLFDVNEELQRTIFWRWAE